MKKFLILIFCFVSLWGVDVNSLIAKAKQGDKNAIYELGYIFENGLGVKKDLQKAKALYQKAANLGNADAKVSLALLELDKISKEHSNKIINNKVVIEHNNGLNLTLSLSDLKAIVKRAKQNDSNALFTLATLYESGILKGDSSKALLLYKKAALLGNKKAQKILSIKKGATKK